MNLWYPIGILLSVFIVYWSYKDAQQLRADPDGFLLDTLHGENNSYYLTLQTALNRITRAAVHDLMNVEDPDRRQKLLEERVLTMRNKERVLDRALWEIRFRLVAFAIFGLFLLYDFLTTGGAFSF